MNKILKGAFILSSAIVLGGCFTKTEQIAECSGGGFEGQSCNNQPQAFSKAVAVAQPTVVAVNPAQQVQQNMNPPEEQKQPLPPPDLIFLVNGEGIAPQNTISPAQASALAKRAAVADAYRQLTEKLYGVKVNARETVRDAVLQNSNIMLRVDGLIRNAQIIDTQFKDGMYIVTMELRISRERWRTVFF